MGRMPGEMRIRTEERSRGGGEERKERNWAPRRFSHLGGIFELP